MKYDCQNSREPRSPADRAGAEPAGPDASLLCDHPNFGPGYSAHTIPSLNEARLASWLCAVFFPELPPSGQSLLGRESRLPRAAGMFPVGLLGFLFRKSAIHLEICTAYGGTLHPGHFFFQTPAGVSDGLLPASESVCCSRRARAEQSTSSSGALPPWSYPGISPAPGRHHEDGAHNLANGPGNINLFHGS